MGASDILALANAAMQIVEAGAKAVSAVQANLAQAKADLSITDRTAIEARLADAKALLTKTSAALDAKLADAEKR